MRQIEVINLETIIDVTAETSNVEILVQDYDAELVERFALEAQEAAIEAEESADIATAQASIATAQANIATTQAGIATTQAGIATTQAGIATTKANEASASAASALASEQAADADRIAAQAAASTATTQAGISTTQAGIATTKAGEASASAASALASETDAETAASTATTQAGIATTQAGIATTQAGIATTQAGNALTSANNAAASAAAAAQVGTSTLLTGLPALTNTAITATDSILQAFAEAQGQINARVSGTGASGQVAFWNGTSSQTGDNGLFWDNTNKLLGVGINAPTAKLHVLNLVSNSEYAIFSTSSDANRALSFSSFAVSSSNSVGHLINALSSGGALALGVNGERWRITSTGILQSNGAQTIQTSTGNLTLTSADNTGLVDIRRTDRALGAELRLTNSFNGSGWLVGDVVGTLNFVSADTTTTQPIRSQIRAISLGGVTFPSLMGLTFSTANGDTLNEGFRLTNTSNLLVGTTTDAGFRLDVLGSTRFNGLSTIQGTTASDSGQLGTELLTTGTGDASWTGTDFATGYTHVAGSTTTLTSTLAGVVSTSYQITYTVTGRTAGSFTIAFGGFTSAALTATGAVGPQATTTGTLVITPTSDFNGTIVLSIRVISSSQASITFNSSAGTATNTIRISSSATNTFIGLNSGRRNTTGVNNCFYGTNSGRDNTTGIQNTFLGANAGVVNTTGSSNSFFGESTGFSNTTGVNNSFFGRDSGDANTIGNNNSFFGAASGGGNTTGNQNSFFGISAGLANTTGSNNVSIGQSSSLNNITGSQNVVIGNDAGRFAGSGTTAMTSVDNSIYLGYQSRGLNATGSTNELVIGVNVVGLGSNTTSLGNASTTFGRWYGSLLLGTTTNAASSILTMESTTQGFLPPRMTSAQRNLIGTPATGLVVYNTTDNRLSVFNGTSWVNLATI